VLSFTAENAVVGQDQGQVQGDIAPGCYVLLTVADTGTGIPRRFWTESSIPSSPREARQRHRVGLSTVMGIVKSHGGFLQVHSELKKGTQFKVYLPALAKAQDQPEGERQPLPKGQGEVLLLVDDEAPFLSMTKEILENSDTRC